jgi:hypothetical protein
VFSLLKFFVALLLIGFDAPCSFCDLIGDAEETFNELYLDVRNGEIDIGDKALLDKLPKITTKSYDCALQSIMKALAYVSKKREASVSSETGNNETAIMSSYERILEDHLRDLSSEGRYVEILTESGLTLKSVEELMVEIAALKTASE